MKIPMVLLVLEEGQDLKAYGTALRNHGYQTRLCASPGEGINSVDDAAVSLVIVGQDTPAFEGRQVLQYCLKRRPEVPVLVVARALDMQYYLDAMDLGAADYLESPEPKDLAWVVETQILRAA